MLMSFQGWARIVKEHQSIVYSLSFTIAGFTSFMMWLAFRRVRSEKWLAYFSWSFLFLSAQYLVLLVLWYANAHPCGERPPALEHPLTFPLQLFILPLLSTGTNLFVVAAARDIENQSPVLPLWCWLLAVGAVLMGIVGNPPTVQHIGALLQYPYEDHLLFYELLGRSLDSVFSAICLFLVGYAIFSNITMRRYGWMAILSIFIAGTYAVVQLTYGLAPVLAERYVAADDFSHRLDLFDSFMRGVALPLKIGLCTFAYFLVMRFFETLHEVRRLQDKGIDERQDYLSSGGVVGLIGKNLTDQMPAHEYGSFPDGKSPQEDFVNLVIKLPGEKNKRLACILWPDDSEEKRVKILDWITPAPGRFSPLSVKGDAGDMHNAMTWEKALVFAEKVITEESSKEIIWPDDYRKMLPDNIPYNYDPNRIVSEVIEAHGAAIGCLQVARSRYSFSQMAIRQIREIANLVSPAVQAYRELAGLDQMSIRFAEKQAEEKTYPPTEAAEVIAAILHDVFGSVVTRLHIDFGFFRHDPIYLQHEEEKSHYVERLIKKMNHEFEGKKWAEYPKSVVSDNMEYKLLKKQLTARVTETFSIHESQPPVPDRFITGNLILAVDEKRDRYDHPTLGVTYLHRKAASTLASDAYLDFARDYYNDLLKRLGEKLSQNIHTIEEWFSPVNEILKEAKISWVLVEQKGRADALGDRGALRVLKNLDEPSAKETPVGQIKIIHHVLVRPELNSSHVLGIPLEASEGFIWLGVERQGFGPELDFSSPWRTFLLNFAQVADAALARITLPEKFQLQLEAAQLQGIISAVVTTETVMHQLSNSIQAQTGSMSTLLDALKVKRLKAEGEDLEQIIYAMKDSADRMQDMFQSLFRLTKTEDHRPCKLREAARHASKLFEVAMLRRRIDLEIDIPSDIRVDVPFNVAALALANLVGNSKDAVDNNGRITIEARRDGSFAMCHVIDDGRGISPEIIDRIFEPRVSSKKFGTGLGLFLTRHSLSENRSSIELTRTGPDGTVFTIKFPLAKEGSEV